MENLRRCKVVGVIDKVMTQPGTWELRLGLDQRECKLEGPGSWVGGARPPRMGEYLSIGTILTKENSQATIQDPLGVSCEIC